MKQEQLWSMLLKDDENMKTCQVSKYMTWTCICVYKRVCAVFSLARAARWHITCKWLRPCLHAAYQA